MARMGRGVHGWALCACLGVHVCRPCMSPVPPDTAPLPPPVPIAAPPARLPLYASTSLARFVRLLSDLPTHPPRTHLPTYPSTYPSAYPSTYGLPVLLGGGGLVHTVRGAEDARLKRAGPPTVRPWGRGRAAPSRAARLGPAPLPLWPFAVVVHAVDTTRHLGRGERRATFIFVKP